MIAELIQAPSSISRAQVGILDRTTFCDGHHIGTGNIEPKITLAPREARVLAGNFQAAMEATAPAAKERSFYMRMRPTDGAAVVFAATLAATVGSPGPRRRSSSSRSSSSPSPCSNSEPRATIIAGGAATGRGTRPPSRAEAVHRAREARRGEVELHLLGQERKSAGEIRGQLVAGFAHPQRSSGAASQQQQRPRQRRGAPGKPRGRRQYAAPRAAGPAQRPQRERRRAGAQFRPRRQHPRRYLRREARRGVQARIDEVLEQSN